MKFDKDESHFHEMRPRSGTIRCTWATCPEQECDSRAMGYWSIDYEQDEFWCSSCLILLQQPIFCLPRNGKRETKPQDA